MSVWRRGRRRLVTRRAGKSCSTTDKVRANISPSPAFGSKNTVFCSFNMRNQWKPINPNKIWSGPPKQLFWAWFLSRVNRNTQPENKDEEAERVDSSRSSESDEVRCCIPGNENRSDRMKAEGELEDKDGGGA